MKNNYTRYSLNGKTYEIPNTIADFFLRDNPEAELIEEEAPTPTPNLQSKGYSLNGGYETSQTPTDRPDESSFDEDKLRNQLKQARGKIDDSLNESMTQSYQAELDKDKKKGFFQRLGEGLKTASIQDAGAQMMSDLNKMEGGTNPELRQEIATKKATRKALDDAQKMIDEADKNQRGNWWQRTAVAGFGRGFGEGAFDASTWDGGISDFSNNAALQNALIKLEKGEQLNEAEQALVDAKAIESATNGYFGSQIGNGYKAGLSAGQSLPFMAEMAANPASGLGKALAGKVANKAGKVLTRVGGDILGSAGMAATSGAIGVAADALDRMAGNSSFYIDDKGDIQYNGQVNQESTGKAFTDAFVARAIENHSEMIGNYFLPVLNALGKGTLKGMEKIGLKGMVDFLRGSKINEIAKGVQTVADRTKWSGSIGEFAEEIVGGLENAALVHDVTADADPETGIFDKDNMLTTAMAVSAFGGVASTFRTGGYIVGRNKVSKANANAQVLFGDNWADIKQSLNKSVDDLDEDGIRKTINDYSEGNKDKANALINYAKAEIFLKGAQLGKFKQYTEGTMNPVEQGVAQSYDNGYSLETAQEMNDAKNMLDYRREELQKAIGKDDVTLGEVLDEQDMPYDENQRQIMIDYLNAKSNYEGMIQKVKDNIQSEEDIAFADIDAKTNTDSGRIVPATLKANDSEVYVVSGKVVASQDGGIDLQNSDKSIVIRDSETGQIKMVSPEALSSLGTEIDPVEEKNSVQAEIRQKVASEAANKIDGVLSFNQGDTYTLTNDQGQPFQIQIVANELGIVDNGDGTVNVLLGGQEATGPVSITPIPKEQIQQMFDNSNLVRLGDYLEAKQMQKNEKKVDDTLNNLELNKIIKLYTDNGPVEVQITSNLQDGKIEVMSDVPIDGKKVNMYTPEELTALMQPRQAEPKPISESPKVPEAPKTALEQIPVDESGARQYRKAPVETTWNAFVERANGDAETARMVASESLDEAKKVLEQAKKKKPSGSTIDEKFDSAAKIKEEINSLQADVDYWKEVVSYEDNQAKLANEEANKTISKIDDELGEPQSFREYALRRIARGAVKFKWEDDPNIPGIKGLGSHLGLKTKDERNQRIGLLSNNGLTPEKAAEELLNGYANELNKSVSELPINDMDALNEVIDIMSSNPSRRAMIDEAKSLRIDPEAKRKEWEDEQLRAAQMQAEEEAQEKQNEEIPVASADVQVPEGNVSIEPINEIENARGEVNTEPTEAQKQAGNYKMGHIKLDGYDISLENPKGSIRKGVDENGKQWQSEMHNDYGYLRGTQGVDGDHIDVFLSDTPEQGNVYVVDQVNPKTGEFDEHKVMYGFNSVEEAQAAYLSNYEEGWQGLGNITPVSKEEFKKWIDSSHRKTKPFAEYAGVKPLEEVQQSGDYKVGDTFSNETGLTGTVDAIAPNGDIRLNLTQKIQFGPDGHTQRWFKPEEFANYAEHNGMKPLQDVAVSEEEPVVKQVDVEGLFNALKTKGEARLSDFATPVDVPKQEESVPKAEESEPKQEESVPKTEETVSKQPLGTIRTGKHTKTGEDLWIVTPTDRVSKEEFSQLKAAAKERDGYYSSFKPNNGFIFKTEEDAKAFNEENSRKPSEPVSLDTMKSVVGGSFDTVEAKQEETKENEPARKWQYELYVSKEGYSRITRSDMSNPYGIEDEFEITADNPEDLKGILENNGMTEILDSIGDKLHNRIVLWQVHQQAQNEGFHGYKIGDNIIYTSGNKEYPGVVTDFEEYGEHLPVVDTGLAPVMYEVAHLDQIRHAEEPVEKVEQPANPSGNKLVTDERYAELKRRMLDKLKGQMNMGIDPEILAIGTEMAVYHIEKGTRKFVDYAKSMIEDLGDVIRPYLKAFYNGARDLPEMGDLAKEMTPYDEVSSIDTANFDKATTDVFAAAETIAKEQEVEEQADEAKERIKTSTKPLNNKKKTVPSRSESMGSLFADIEEGTENEPTNTDNNELSTGSTSKNGEVGEGAQQKVERTSGTGVVGNNHGNSAVDNGGSTGLAERTPQAAVKKNKSNNHVERGESYAPTSPGQRFSANVAAIKKMRELTDAGKQATKEDMSILRQFTGWGGLGTYFNNEYSQENRQLKSLLSSEEYEGAVMSANSAYYTPVNIIDAMWDAAKNLGFTGGTVLEGSAGIGNILASMPKKMSEASDITAVEIDSVTGNILKLLYPDATVHIKGFEETEIPNNSVDLAITNVPFVTGLRVNDEVEQDLSRKFGDIHDFCIAKNVRKLKEGGIGIFITSKGTLDKSKALRSWLVNQGDADVIGAFRLNNDTFVGTSVTSDIIIVRKRVNGKPSPNAIDVSGTTVTRRGTYSPMRYGEKDEPVAMEYNTYFVEHPENMAGEMAFAFEKGDTFRPKTAGLYKKEGIDQDKAVAKWVKSLRNDGEKVQATANEQQEEQEKTENVKEGQIIVNSKGEICVSRRGQAVPLGVNSNKVKGQTKATVIKDYDAIKEALKSVLDYQMKNDSDEGLKPLLKTLNDAYDSFVKKYGQLNKNVSISFLRDDVDFAAISAIENFKEVETIDGKKKIETSKTDVFSRRMVGYKAEPTPKTSKEGVIVSMNQFGRIDLDYIASKVGMPVEDVRKEIIDNGLGFEDPRTGHVEVSNEYLSGNVREKLEYARKHNEGGKYDANIKALEKVVPLDIPAHLIEFSLGSDWLDPKLYVDFAREKFGLNDEFKVANIGGVCQIVGGSYAYFDQNNEKNRSAGITSDIVGKTATGHELMICAMNNTPYVFQKTVTHGYGSDKWTETVTDKAASQAATARMAEIQEEFKEWCKDKMLNDEALAAEVTKIYNDLFNAVVPKEVGEEFLPEHFDGSNMKINLYDHQKKAIIRGTTEPLMLAHEVGSGKTFTLISTAMEMRRLGTAKKPMIVVQNATVGQFVSEAKKLYPNAKVLTITEKDRSQDGRAAFYAKIKYNDWDLIIIPQSVLDTIPDSEERQQAFIQEKIDEKMFVLEQAKTAKAGYSAIKQLKKELADLQKEYDTGISVKASKKDAKKEAVAKNNAAVRAKQQVTRKIDDVENFDDMGIDALLIDEAHEYKHLGFSTALNRGVKGVDPSYSKKSAGVYLKTRAVFDKSGWKNVVFATGTPISNTAAEIWTFMKYLMPADVMKQNHIYYFDDFVRNFGKIAQSLAFATNGKFKENTRFGAYVNLPELVRIWSSVSDTVLTKDAEAASGVKLTEKLPEMEGGKAQDIFLPQSPSLIGIMRIVKQTLEDYDKLSGKEKKAQSHIPLTMYGIAKRAAIDPRLIDPEAADEPLSKTNKAVEEILKDLEATKEYNGTCAVFCDNYRRLEYDETTGKKKETFNLFYEIKRKLVEAGVPENQIVVMESGMTVEKKEKIFAQVNEGTVRVILGSTRTLGTGVNIQQRLHLLIHMDAPDRPMDYTQRNGRILRQGNLHKQWGKTVKVLRFGVEDSLDVTSYQRLKTKSAFIDSVMDGKPLLSNGMENRVLEEEEEGLFDNPVAVLSGSQFALKKSQAERELRKYQNKLKQYQQDQIYIERQLKDNKAHIERNVGYIADYEKSIAKANETFKDGKVKVVTVAGVPCRTEEELSAAIREKITKPLEETKARARNDYGWTAKDLSYTLSFDGIDVNVTFTIGRKEGSYINGQNTKPSATTSIHYKCPDLMQGIEFTISPMDGIKGIVERFRNEFATGQYQQNTIDRMKANNERMASDNELMQQRRGVPFGEQDKLDEAKDRVAEYTKLMKDEMAEKEKKYAEAQAVESNINLDNVDADEEDKDTNRYRSSEPVNIFDAQYPFRELRKQWLETGEIYNASEAYEVLKQLLEDYPDYTPAFEQFLDMCEKNNEAFWETAGRDVEFEEEQLESAFEAALADEDILNAQNESFANQERYRIRDIDGMTAEELDKAYMDVVNSGDMETAAQMVRDAFKAAYPDTKVVDEEGNPIELLHLSESKHTVFGPGINPNVQSLGFFTDDRKQPEDYAKKYWPEAVRYNTFLNLHNPLIIDFAGSDFYAPKGEAAKYGGDTDNIVARVRSGEFGDYDGVIMKNVGGEFAGNFTESINDYVPFNSSQIKSADVITYDDEGNIIPLSQRFKEGNEDIRFSIREKEAPVKTGTGYKVFVLKNGRLYPPMVNNAGGVDTPVFLWLDAEAAPIAGQSKTGRNKVKSGGGTLAYRPGWHLGKIPYALQFNRGEKVDNPLGIKNLKGNIIKVGKYFPKNFVWAEVEYAADKNYQKEAMSYGYNENGKFQHSLAGLPAIPEDGYYEYRTNANPATDPWIITGAMRVKKILTPSEVDALVEAAGRKPQLREEGAYSDAQIEQLNESLSKLNEDSADSKIETAMSLAESLGVKVNVIEDRDQITDKNRTRQRRKRNSKGWYDTISQEIVVVIPNNVNNADVEATILHEIVGHKGMRELVGDENYNDFLEKVYRSADPELRKKITELAARKGWDFNLATEEYIASLAENGFNDRLERNLFEKIRDLFVDMLRRAKIALGHNINDNDLRYMLWRAYKGRIKSALDLAEDINARMNMQVGDYAESNNNVRLREGAKLNNSTDNTPLNEWHEDFERTFTTEENGKKRLVSRFFQVFNVNNKNIDTNKAFEQYYIPFRKEIEIRKLRKKYIIDYLDKKVNEGKAKVRQSSKSESKYYFINGGKIRVSNHMYPTGSMTDSMFDIYDMTDYNAPDMVDNFLGIDSREAVDGTLRFRTGEARDIYEQAERRTNKEGQKTSTANLFHRLHEAYLDSMLALKDFQEAVVKETGVPIEDFENAYIAENAMSSKNAAEAKEEYAPKYYNPLLKEIENLERNGAVYSDIKNYLIAKHGLERNAKFARRDAQKAMAKQWEEYNAKYGKQSEADVDADARDAERARLQEAEDALTLENEKKDYSGLTELTGDKENFNDKARQIVDIFESQYKTEDLWKRINAATKASLHKSYISGLMDKATYENVRDMFDYYIPLRGWDKDTAGNEYEYLISRDPLFEQTLKIAGGRITVSEDPIATIGYMANSAIAIGNRNMMKQKFLNFVLNHPTNLASVNKQWYVKDVTGEWEPRFPEFPKDATGEQIAQIVDTFESTMRGLQKMGLAKTEREGLKLGKHITVGQEREHIVRVKRGGREYIVYINGNPRVAQALNGLTNPDFDLKWLERKLQVLKNFMARAFTTDNPAFILANLSRDQIWAASAVNIKESKEYSEQYRRNAWRALKSMASLLRKLDEQSLDENEPIERYFKEFIMNGGETGYTNFNTIEDFKKDIKRIEKQIKGGAVQSTKGVLRTALNAIEHMNRWAENATRFATFMTSRQHGRSIARSVFDAKEITVNFNKKGSGNYLSRLMNFSYLFFNATMQSLANVGRLMKTNPKRTIATFSTFGTLGFTMPLLALMAQALMGGGDDDDKEAYWNLPTWVRRNNLVIYFPFSKHGFITIPLPHELRPFYGLGETALSVLLGKEDMEDGLKDGLLGFSTMMPVDLTANSGNIVVNLTPDAGKPIAQIVANVDYFGKPIYKKNAYNELDPEWTKVYKSTNSWLIQITKGLNSATGGDIATSGSIDLNPAMIEHIAEGYLGGSLKTVNNFGKLIGMTWDGDKREWRNVPVLNAFGASAEERTSNSQLNREYYDYQEKHDAMKRRISKYRQQIKMGNMEYSEKLQNLFESKEYEEYAKHYTLVEGISKMQSNLKYVPEEQKDEYEKMILENKKQLVSDLHSDKR